MPTPLARVWPRLCRVTDQTNPGISPGGFPALPPALLRTLRLVHFIHMLFSGYSELQHDHLLRSIGKDEHAWVKCRLDDVLRKSQLLAQVGFQLPVSS